MNICLIQHTKRLIFSSALFIFLLLFTNQRVYAAPGDIVTVAGGGAGDGDVALSVPIVDGYALAYDSSGNLFFADCSLNRVRKIAPAGLVSTVAGIGTAGFSGDGGPAIDAALSCPSGVAVDNFGNLFISDQNNHRIRKVDSTGAINTIAGTGIAGYSGSDGPAISAKINKPLGLTVDGSGSVYFADYANNRVRKINSSGVISTVAGNGMIGPYATVVDGVNATQTPLAAPSAVSVDLYGSLYIADKNHHRIRKVDSLGIISTVAGNGTASFDYNSLATSSALNAPTGVYVRSDGAILIADSGNNRVRIVDPGGAISTLVGTGSAGFSGDGSSGDYAMLNNPYAVTVGPLGIIVFIDKNNRRIRKLDCNVDRFGLVSTIAGNGSVFWGEGVPALSASLMTPADVVADRWGNMYVADTGNNVIRKIDSAGTITTFAGNLSAGYSGDGGSAINATLNYPYGLALSNSNNLYFADLFNWRIRIVKDDGIIETVAGNGIAGYSGDYGPATAASLKAAFDVTVDAFDNIYIADRDNHRIRRIDSAGIITTIAGTGVAGFTGDGGPAFSASINSPFGITSDAAGNIYFSDYGNQRIRKIDSSGVITTIAGNGTAGYSGDGGDAISASLNIPIGIALDTSGNVYFADSGNHRVRKIETGGTITTVAGNGAKGFSGDNSVATNASLNTPVGVAIDVKGNILIADANNNRIRKVIATDPFSITINTSANGTIIGPATVNYGDNANYVITPDVGYHVVDVIIDGISVGVVNSYTFSNVKENHSITATFSISTFTITATTGANGSITAPTTVAYGSSVSYIITPANGYHVADVLVDGVSVGAVTGYTFSNVTADHTLSASFAINSYSITASAGVNGTIAGPTTATYGDSVSYTITPAAGYHVADVLVNGVSIGAVTSYIFSNVTANHTISASFAINSYSITATAGANGTIAGPATATYGDSASYTITPAAGYHVADVLVDGVSVGAVTSYTFANVTANHTISASFAINSYSITVSAGANGTISGPTTATYGSSADYTITPATGYRIVDVLVDGTSIGAVTGYAFTNVTASHTISATFVALADLTATSVTAPTSTNRGKGISVSTSIKNQGGTNAGSFVVAFYLSKNATVTSSDILLGTKTISLNAGSTETVSGSFTVPRSMDRGNYYIGVIADSGSAIIEANESNNRMVANNTTTVK